MRKGRLALPLFSRIVVLVLCSVLIAVLVVVFASPKFRQDLNLANVFVLFVGAMVACFGIWMSLCGREYTPDELEAEAALSTHNHPDVSEHALVCRFSTFTKSAAVFLDTASGQIYFEGCHVPRKLLATTHSWFSCQISDLKGTHLLHKNLINQDGESLTIVTSVGKALIPATASNYVQLRDVLKEIVPYTQPGFSIDHPMMGLVYLAGAFLGLFAGAALTPRNAGDSTLGLFVLGGAILGVATGHLLVFMADRSLTIGLVQPIGFGMLGAIVGVIAHRPFAPLVGWNAGIAFIVVGILIGCVFGIMKQTRERR